MGRATTFPSQTDELQPLLERLGNLDAPVVYYPVRHHSPMCASLLSPLIDQVKPKAILIEGPCDYNPHLSELALDHVLPIAIYSYFSHEDGESFGAFYPFCEYSPEWIALREAHRRSITARFIDSPWTETARLDRHANRYADADMRRGKYLELLGDKLGLEGFDDIWDHLIESQVLDVREYLTRVHSLCTRQRFWEQDVSEADRCREAFMATQIQEAQREFGVPLLVITGAFHSSALVARLEGFACPGLEVHDTQVESEPITQQGIALTPYSYQRLDNLTGYDAGMPSPGFYQTVWECHAQQQPYSHRPLLRLLVAELRQRKQTLSTSDLIAIETAAQGLCAIRGRSRVWRRDLIDAVVSAVIKDELEYGGSSPVLDAVHAIMRGKQQGALAPGTRVPALVHEIKQHLTTRQLHFTQGRRELNFNLLEPADRLKSQLLHRLKLLGIAGFQRTGGTDFIQRVELTKLWDTWTMVWSPSFEGSCIEASRYGSSLQAAVTGRLTEKAKQIQRDSLAVAALLVETAQAGIDSVSNTLLDILDDTLHQESDFSRIAQTLGHLLYLFCHDEAMDCRASPRLGRLLAESFTRALWLLEAVGHIAGPEKQFITGLQHLLETYQRCQASLGISGDEFVSVMNRVVKDEKKPPLASGAAAGILWTLGDATGEQVLQRLLRFADPSHLGDFLTGLFALSRETAQRHPELILTIDRLLLEFGAEDFQQSLPSLRLAFTYFTPREKHYMLTTLFTSLGLKDVKPLEKLAVDDYSAAAALAFEDRLFAELERYSLLEPSP